MPSDQTNSHLPLILRYSIRRLVSVDAMKSAGMRTNNLTPLELRAMARIKNNVYEMAVSPTTENVYNGASGSTTMYSARKTKKMKKPLMMKPTHHVRPSGRMDNGTLMTKVDRVGRNHHWKVALRFRDG